MIESRTKKSKRNILSGLVYKLITIVLPFVNRTIILWTLGAEFTGLNGLFSSILQVLNIAELGFNTSIVYSLYEPMSKKDIPQIIKLVSLIRKVYHIVGTTIFVLGMAIMPFLKHLIHGTYPNSVNLYFIYFLYLLNSSLSYFMFAYKEVLLIADQRQDISNVIRCVASILRYTLEFIILCIFKNFYLYLSASIIATLFTNILIQICTVRNYPYVCHTCQKLCFPKELISQVQGLMIGKVCDTCRNSFDNLIITTFVGLTATAIYGNYYYIYTALYSIMLVICNSISASVGNSIIEESIEKNYNNLIIFTYVFSIIQAWCTICLACLYQPFMKIWVGDSLILPLHDMLLFCLYFYIINMTNIRNQFITGTGIWWKLRIPCIVEAIFNLVLNLILGKIWGITGVILATLITILLFNFIWQTKILFNEYFVNYSFAKYLMQYVQYFVVMLIALLITFTICNQFALQGVEMLAVRLTICTCVSPVLLLIGYRFSKYYTVSKKFILQVLRK